MQQQNMQPMQQQNIRPQIQQNIQPQKEVNILDMNEEEFTLGTKGHYYSHGTQYQDLWRMSLGYSDEESVEKFHKDSSAVFIRYNNQRGSLATKYAMNHLLLLK